MMRTAVPDSKIVIVTAFDRTADIRDCLIAGADGCLLKDTSETDMAAALRAAVTDATALDPRIAFQLAHDLEAQPADMKSPGSAAVSRTCSTSSRKAVPTGPSPGS